MADPTPSLFIFNNANGTTMGVTPMHRYRSHFSATSYGGKGVLVCGGGSGPPATAQPVATCDLFTFSTRLWSWFASLPTNNTDGVMLSLAGRPYLIGGSVSGNVDGITDAVIKCIGKIHPKYSSLAQYPCQKSISVIDPVFACIFTMHIGLHI